MNNQSENLENFDMDSNKPSQTLNVLTILTFIGCAIGALFTIGTPAIMSFSKKMILKAQESADLKPDQIAELRKGLEGIELAEKNMVPLIVVGIAGIVLCFVGALMMRKLKKDGFWIYTAGQVLPIIAGLLIMGTSQYQNLGSFIFPFISVLFIFLYASQRKYLKY